MEKGIFLQPEKRNEGYFKNLTEKVTAAQTVLQAIVTAYNDIGVTVSSIDEIIEPIDTRTRKVVTSRVENYVNSKLGAKETPDISGVLTACKKFQSYEYNGFFSGGIFSHVYEVRQGKVSVTLADYEAIKKLAASIDSTLKVFRVTIIE